MMPKTQALGTKEISHRGPLPGIIMIKYIYMPTTVEIPLSSALSCLSAGRGCTESLQPNRGDREEF
jgi:hypothetical protein